MEKNMVGLAREMRRGETMCSASYNLHPRAKYVNNGVAKQQHSRRYLASRRASYAPKKPNRAPAPSSSNQQHITNTCSSTRLPNFPPYLHQQKGRNKMSAARTHRPFNKHQHGHDGQRQSLSASVVVKTRPAGRRKEERREAVKNPI